MRKARSHDGCGYAALMAVAQLEGEIRFGTQNLTLEGKSWIPDPKGPTVELGWNKIERFQERFPGFWP